LRRRASARTIRDRVFWVSLLKSGGFPPKPEKIACCLFPSTAKHLRRGRQGFPVEKTGIGAQNVTRVFRLKSGGLTPKPGKLCWTPCLFPTPENTYAVGHECFQAEKTGIGAQNQKPVCGVNSLKSGGLSPKLGKVCGSPRLFPRAAKHSCRGRKGFPAEKTGICELNVRRVFRDQPDHIRQFASKTGKLLQAPLPLSEHRKTLASGFPS